MIKFRRNKHHNRLRFLIEDIGIEELKKLYRDEFRRLKEEYVVLRKIDLQEREEIDEEIPNGEEEDYKEFLKYNVYSQKTEGFCLRRTSHSSRRYICRKDSCVGGFRTGV